MWFGSVDTLSRLIVVGVLSYITMVVLLRISGARTLAKLNAFDFVVTIALGSVLASAFLTNGLPLSSVVSALIILIGLQWLVAFTSSRAQGLRRTFTATPALLVEAGNLRKHDLQRVRITEDEVFQAIRNSGSGGLGDVAAAVLETDGTISVIPTSSVGDGVALQGVPGWDENARA